jgi:small subunit ribosomal protein S4
MLLGKSGIERRGTAPPGQHGQRRRSRPSIYALQLREKQRAKRYYGARESQFRRYVREATRQREERMGRDELLAGLERRLDNVVYRLGLASTRAQARQFVTHRHVLVNGRLVTIPSFLVDEAHVVAMGTTSPVEPLTRGATETVSAIPAWLEADFDTLSGRILRRAARGDVTAPVDVQLIVEFYSRR